MEKKNYYKYTLQCVLSVKKIVTIHYQKLDKNYSSVLESHDFWEMIYCDKNQLTCVISGECHTLKRGEILFIKPNSEHYVLGNSIDNSNIFIASFVSTSKTMTFFKDKKFLCSLKVKDILSNIMNEAKNTFIIPEFNPKLEKLEVRKNPIIGGMQLIKNNLESLFIELIRGNNSQNLTSEIFITRYENDTLIEHKIITFLHQNLYSKLTLDDICEYVHYGKTSITKKFKNSMGSTIINYYLKLKIEESKNLIRKNESFSSIASKLYFDSLSHFTNTFKKHEGMNPSEYKNSILN